MTQYAVISYSGNTHQIIINKIYESRENAELMARRIIFVFMMMNRNAGKLMENGLDDSDFILNRLFKSCIVFSWHEPVDHINDDVYGVSVIIASCTNNVSLTNINQIYSVIRTNYSENKYMLLKSFTSVDLAIEYAHQITSDIYSNQYNNVPATWYGRIFSLFAEFANSEYWWLDPRERTTPYIDGIIVVKNYIPFGMDIFGFFHTDTGYHEYPAVLQGP